MNTFFRCLCATTAMEIGGGFLCMDEGFLASGGFAGIHGHLLYALFLE